jgi:phenylacetate-coenzyme A ligase PaaK-like adenylate-forming protein
VNSRLILAVLRMRREHRRRERWSRPALESFQAGAFAELRRFAYERSAFYRRFHRGLEDKSLAELPVLTKAQLIAGVAFRFPASRPSKDGSKTHSRCAAPLEAPFECTRTYSVASWSASP